MVDTLPAAHLVVCNVVDKGGILLRLAQFSCDCCRIAQCSVAAEFTEDMVAPLAVASNLCNASVDRAQQRTQHVPGLRGCCSHGCEQRGERLLRRGCCKSAAPCSYAERPCQLCRAQRGCQN